MLLLASNFCYGPTSTLVCAGGGAVEAALSIYLENFATTLESREQLAIAEFANALLVIPKVLLVALARECWPGREAHLNHIMLFNIPLKGAIIPVTAHT